MRYGVWDGPVPCFVLCRGSFVLLCLVCFCNVLFCFVFCFVCFCFVSFGLFLMCCMCFVGVCFVSFGFVADSCVLLRSCLIACLRVSACLSDTLSVPHVGESFCISV